MRVTIDPKGLVAVCNEAEAMTAQREAAAAAAEQVQRDGPKNPAHRKHVVDKISVGDTRKTPEGAATAIRWDSPFWHLVEFGNAHHGPYRPVTRAAQAVGLRVVESRG